MSQICNNCVMDTTDTKIRFDVNGICDHCNTFYEKTLPSWRKMKSNKDKFINNFKNKSVGEFDCIIGMSGGVDSSYLVYKVKEEMGLNPLVFHVDGGWNSDLAVNNIEKIVDGLKLELFTDVINWDEMRRLQLAYFKSGVSTIDTPQDHAFFATMYKFANKYNIKYIFTGANIATEGIRNPVDWMYYQTDSTQLKDIFNKHGVGRLDTFPLTSIIWHKIYLPIIKRIKVIKPLNYFEYNKKDAMAILSSKFGWKPYPQKHFESRFTKFYESYWLFERFGYDVRKVQLSSLILTKQMTRDQAILELNEKPYDPNEIYKDKEFIANKLEITLDQLDGYFRLPKKYYYEYRSQKNIYKYGSLFSKILNSEIGQKR